MATNPGFGDTMGTTGFGAGTGDAASGTTGTASDLGQQAKDAAQNIGGQAKAALGDLHGQAKDAAGDLRDQAMKYKDQALDQARTAAEEGKTKAADTIHGVADTLRQSASQFGQNATVAPVGRYANQAADALENFAGKLRDKDVDQLVTEVSGFVRRNPAIAIGVAVAAGFALTQLLRGGSSNANRFADDYNA